jgi:hypothetical protein
MVSRFAPVRRTGIFNPQLIHQEFTELERPAGNTAGQCQPAGIICKQLQVMMTNHVDARAGRTHDGFGWLESTQKIFSRPAGLAVIAGVEGRLTAASMIALTGNSQAQTAEYCQHGLTHPGRKCVHQALDEKSHMGLVFHRQRVASKSVKNSLWG